MTSIYTADFGHHDTLQCSTLQMYTLQQKLLSASNQQEVCSNKEKGSFDTMGFAVSSLQFKKTYHGIINDLLSYNKKSAMNTDFLPVKDVEGSFW